MPTFQKKSCWGTTAPPAAAGRAKRSAPPTQYSASRHSTAAHSQPFPGMSGARRAASSGLRFAQSPASPAAAKSHGSQKAPHALASALHDANASMPNTNEAVCKRPKRFAPTASASTRPGSQTPSTHRASASGGRNSPPKAFIQALAAMNTAMPTMMGQRFFMLCR